MTGRNLLNGECTFEMVQVDAAGASVAGFAKRTVSNTLLISGNISFGAINYTEADAGKTYYYKVTEVAGSAGGVTYDSRPIYATVRVGTDNGDGTLAASTVTYTLSLGGTVAENTFRNSYSASGSISLGATKALTGAALADGEFTFTLTQVKADGTAMANGLSTTAVNKGGSVTFPAISYTGADAAGVYYYRIAERNDGAAGIRYDSSVYTAKVTVTDDGAGKLNTSIQYFDPDGNSIQAGSLPAFSNRYVEGEATITVGKNLIGRTLGSEQFAFTLTQTDANHNAITGGTTRTASNDRSGNVTFSNIKYTAAGTYYYMDIASIEKANVAALIKKRGYDIDVVTKFRANFYVRQNFKMMSIIRNLLTNAAEAIGNEGGRITLSVEISDDKDQYIITVNDNGKGMDDEELSSMFLAGFSTKFDPATGDIQRGMGLSLVKDYVENFFSGQIKVDSEKGKYTEFTITMPTEVFRGNGEKANEVLHS